MAYLKYKMSLLAPTMNVINIMNIPTLWPMKMKYFLSKEPNIVLGTIYFATFDHNGFQCVDANFYQMF